MHFAKTLSVALLFALLVGCGSVGDSPVSVTPPSSTATDAIKAALNDVVQSGQLGSGGMALEQQIEKLRASDAAKADVLKKDYEELKGLRDRVRAKAKAQEMISKL